MSLKLAALRAKDNRKNLTRGQILALAPGIKYDDGRTKQSHRDETDIVKIMARFATTGTISHLSKHEPQYADFSDFDFHKQMNMLTRGREIFDDLPAEVRDEFSQSPAAFFKYVNDPKNIDDLRKKLPALAAPGLQLPRTSPPQADDPEPAPPEPTPDPDPTPDP